MVANALVMMLLVPFFAVGLLAATPPPWIVTEPDVPYCGDGVLASTERCDDGNAKGKDGCSASCTVESGWGCTGAPSSCAKLCGNGRLDDGEICDDGNRVSGDGCNNTCKQKAKGYTCATPGSLCVQLCGNGRLDNGETCDDGNRQSKDGCNGTTCTIESGYSCAKTGSACTPLCGNGRIDSGEKCDDGNTADGDGCSAKCKIGTNTQCTGEPSICSSTTLTCRQIAKEPKHAKLIPGNTPRCQLWCAEQSLPPEWCLYKFDYHTWRYGSDD